MKINVLADKIGIEYLAETARADGYEVYHLDGEDVPSSNDLTPNDYIVIICGKPYLVQMDNQPIVISLLDVGNVAAHLDNGDALAKWMQALI